ESGTVHNEYSSRSSDHSFLIWVGHAQQGTCGGRQNVTETGINHGEVCILGIARTYKPRSASQIGILDVSLQGSIPAVLPESLQPIERDLLNGAVVGIRRAGSAVPDGGSRMRCVGGVGEEISPEVICAIVYGERLFWTGSPFETS